MAQIEVKNMTFYYDDYYHPVFENLNLNLDTDWKLALVGRNGRGKTTLLKLLQGRMEPSSGSIKRCGSISYFPYTYDSTYQKTMDVVKECIGGLKTLELEIEAYACGVPAGEEQKYCEMLAQYDMLDGYWVEGKICRELEQMGLSEDLLERDFFTLSGGEQTCMLIIALFLRKDPFVMLDEPTNHLDKGKKELLKEYLKKKKGYIIASHDTLFLDEVSDHILAINKADIYLEQGNYSTCRRNMELQEQFELRTKQRLIQEIGQLERRSQRNRTWAGIGNTQKYPFASNARANGAKAYMRQAKTAEQNVLDHLEEKKQLLRNLEEEKKLRICQDILEADCLLSVENLSYCYEGEKEPVFENLALRIYPGDKIWIRGKNGAGKTTLLKLLSGELENDTVQYAEGISVAYVLQEPRVKSGNLMDYLQTKWKNSEEFPELYRRFLEYCALFDLPEKFYTRPLETLSSGELKKVEIAGKLSEHHQVLFLDEPLNYMDVYFKAQLEQALSEPELTVVFVDHNEEFGQKVANKIVQL